MRLLVTEGIKIDINNSIAYGGIHITQGKFKGLNVMGNFESTVTDFACDVEGEHHVQAYVNVRSGHVILEELPPVESCIPQAFHIGGVVIDCDDCGNYTIKAELLPENPCIAYKRPFSSAFGISMNKEEAQLDICSVISGVSEFASSYNCDYAIQGTDTICPEDFELYSGNTGLYIGADGLYDGNEPNPI